MPHTDRPGPFTSNEVTLLFGEMRDMREEMRLLREALVKLAGIEEEQISQNEALGRSFRQLEDHGKRIQTIEIRMPGLVELRGWAVLAITSCVGSVLWASLSGHLR